MFRGRSFVDIPAIWDFIELVLIRQLKLIEPPLFEIPELLQLDIVAAAAEARLARRPRAAKVRDARGGDLPQLLLVFRDGMAGQEQAERLALAREPLALAPFRERGDLDRRALVGGER